MNYKTIVLCAVIGASIQSVHGMQNDNEQQIMSRIDGLAAALEALSKNVERMAIAQEKLLVLYQQSRKVEIIDPAESIPATTQIINDAAKAPYAPQSLKARVAETKQTTYPPKKSLLNLGAGDSSDEDYRVPVTKPKPATRAVEKRRAYYDSSEGDM